MKGTEMIDVETYTDVRQNFAAMLDRVNDDSTPILIKRKNGKDAVLMSADDFRGYEETTYLMSNPENHKQIMASIEEHRRGHAVQRDLIEVED